MIRMTQCQSAAQAKEYHKDALSQGDYFINDQEVAGRFYGCIADRLGIAGPVTKEVYDLLCENIHPHTGKLLTSRKIDNRTIGYDINFHCPKSLSVLSALVDDNHIVNAFRKSVYDTMCDIEADAKVRVRDKGQDHDRPSDGLVWAEFVHFTARPPEEGIVCDPHLHAHCMTFNVSRDPVSDKYKAVQFKFIKQDMPYYQSRFHLRLAQNLTDLGYNIRMTRTAFEVENIPDNIIALFSKRTDAIGRYIRENNITDAKEKDKVGAKTRAKKQKGLSLAELKQNWRKQIYGLGLTENGTGDKAIRYAKDCKQDLVTAQECVDMALLDKFERASVVHDRRLLESAYRHALGKDGPTIEAITEQFYRDKRLIQVDDGGKILMTTHEVLAQERRLVALATLAKGKLPPLYASLPALTLEGQQATAALHILTTYDQVVLVTGKAGVGKTTMTKEVVRLIKETGTAVTMVAPTSNASRGVLRDEGFPNAETVDQLLGSPDLQANLTNGVLICDEAGLLSVKKALALLELATKHNCRLVLMGDASQHSAVERGDALRILTTVAGIIPAQISKIYRQKRQDFKEAVYALSQGDVKAGFVKLESMGAIHEMAKDHPYDALAEGYVAALKKKMTALAICPTHAQGHQVTKTIRQKLRDAGMLDQQETPVLSLVNLSMTAAQKNDARNFLPGHVLQFSRSRDGFKRGSRWAVMSAAGSTLILSDDKGRTAPLSLSQDDEFEVYQKTEIPLAKGDKIRISRNGYDVTEKRLNNGQLLTVDGFDKKGRIMTTSLAGKASYTLAPDYGHLAYAHCITSHASQGQTVDHCYVAMPSASLCAANLKQFYVSVSRSREEVHIYTDDRAALLEHISHEGDRQSALELIGKPPLRRSPYRFAPHLIRPSVPPEQPPVEPAATFQPLRKHASKPAPV